MFVRTKCWELRCDNCGDPIDIGEGSPHCKTQKELRELMELEGMHFESGKIYCEYPKCNPK